VRLSEARGRPGGAAPATTTAPIVDPTRPIDGWAGSVRAHMNTEEILDDIRLRIELMPLECGPGVTIPALPPVDRHNPPKVQQRQLHPEGPISVSSPRSAWTAELVPNMRAPRASSRASASPDSEVSGPGGLPDRLPGASGAEGRDGAGSASSSTSPNGLSPDIGTRSPNRWYVLANMADLRRLGRDGFVTSGVFADRRGWTHGPVRPGQTSSVR
jgi:hypothetical protein